MADDENSKHENQNIYLQYENHENSVHKILYSAKYLDTLVITERMELNKDAIFMNNSWPYILQPNSVFHTLWEVVVLVTLLFALFTIPYFCLVFVFELPSTIIVSYYIIAVVWFLDFCIKIFTAVPTKDGIIKNVKKIFFFRMNYLSFIADCIAIVPLEWLSA